MTSLWLNKKRKGELVELCHYLGLPSDGLKSDLESAIQAHLDAHERDLADDETFAPYYDTVVAVRSPTKNTVPTMAAAPELSVSRPRRKASRYVSASALEGPGASTAEESTPEPPTERKARAGSRALSTRTPRAIRSLREAQNIPLPPTPAAVADVIESRTNALLSSAKKAVRDAALEEKAVDVRDRLSNVVSVNMVALTLEAGMMLMALIPWTKEVAIPAVEFAGTKASIVYLPDLFVLLTSGFWAPFITWIFTAFVVPFANSTLFNLLSSAASLKKPGSQYMGDPLTFAVTKALVVYLLKNGFKFGGLLSDSSVSTVMKSVGAETQFINAGIAGIAAIWEGILRR